MLRALVTLLLPRLFPSAPPWLAPTVVAILEETMEVVETLEDAHDLTPAERRENAVRAIGEGLGGMLSQLPEWHEASLEQRQRILEGLVELAVLLVRSAGHDRGRARKALRKLRRAA